MNDIVGGRPVWMAKALVPVGASMKMDGGKL